MAKPVSRRGLLFGAASSALLTAAGLWWALGSLSTACSETAQQAPDGTITTFSGCSSAPSQHESDGLVGVLWLGLPALLAVVAMALSPLARLRAPARWAVGVSVLLLGVLTAFTPFMFLFLPAGGLMVLAAVYADDPPAAESTALGAADKSDRQAGP